MLGLAGLLLLFVNANAETSSLANERIFIGNTCCESLGQKITVIYPNSSTFSIYQNSYWALQQREPTPSCRVIPLSTEEVAKVVRILVSRDCRFSIRSGGHSNIVGASNIKDGVTLDLSSMNSVDVSEDMATAFVGPGARWGDVYTQLEPKSLAVVGGRVSDVGVAGVLLGGGMSYFSNRYGWAADNVHNFEVVTADGSIVNANMTSNPDLYWGLKGGGNNFGIVTKLHLKTFPMGKMWGGLRVHGSYLTPNLSARIFQAFENFGNNLQDPDAHLIISSTYEGIVGLTAWTVSPFYVKPVKDPPVSKEFLDIRPAVSTTRIDTIASFAKELFVGTPSGKRYLFATATFKNDVGSFAKLLDIHYNGLSSVKSSRGFQSSFVLQPISPMMTSKSAANGGNPLGVNPESGPLVWLDVSIGWSDSKDDEAIQQATEGLMKKSVNFTMSTGMQHPYIYMNYAMKDDDVFSSYGAENKKKLLDIKRKYDPGNVFGRLVPGGFKLRA